MVSDDRSDVSAKSSRIPSDFHAICLDLRGLTSIQKDLALTVGAQPMRKSIVSRVMLFAAMLLGAGAVAAWLSVAQRPDGIVYDRRFELLGVKTSFGTNHGGFAAGTCHRALRTVASKFGVTLHRKPDDRFTSREPSYAVVVRYRFPTPPTSHSRSLSAELVCENQPLCKIKTLSTRFEVGRRLVPTGSLRTQPQETVACFFFTNACHPTSNCVIRLKHGSNLLADVNFGRRSIAQ